MRERQPRPVNASPVASTAMHSFELGQSTASSAEAPFSVVADQLDGFVLPASARPLHADVRGSPIDLRLVKPPLVELKKAL